jgi:hypothetical protein
MVVEHMVMKLKNTSEDQETDKHDTTENEGGRVQILVSIC